MKRVLVPVVVVSAVCFLVLSPASVSAKEVSHPICVERTSEDYPTAAAAKLLCGASDVGFGWTEIFWYPTVSESKVQGAMMGPVRMIGRAITGSAELLTFMIPKWNVKKLTPACALAIVDPK